MYHKATAASVRPGPDCAALHLGLAAEGPDVGIRARRAATQWWKTVTRGGGLQDTMVLADRNAQHRICGMVKRRTREAVRRPLMLAFNQCDVKSTA